MKKRTMKRIQMALAALIFTATVAVAQPAAKPDGKEHRFERREMPFSKLNLTEDQKAKMKTANDDFRKQMQALNSNENQTVKQQRDGKEALMKAHKAKLESILTSDQKAQLAKLKEEGKQRHEEMAAKHLNKMKQELSLTDQQVSELKKGQEDLKSKMEAVHNNTSLDRTAKMQQMKALREDMKANLDKVLTPEQKQKWQGMHKSGMHHGKGKFKMHRGDAKPQPQV
jgi:periplasmic protein CpxP/Spy